MKICIYVCRYTSFVRFVLLLIFSLCTAQVISAEVVDLTVTGYWSDREVKVTNSRDKAYNLADPKFDGKIFGIVPTAGDLSLRLFVDTDGAVFIPKGTTFTTDRAGTYTLSHDFYGYKQVKLVDDIYLFGSATWKSDGILAGLDGPGDEKAALWTDVDLTKADPTRVSFRMFGKAQGLSADLFIGSRTPSAIGPQFLLWEYYKGEEIRSSKYTAKSKVLGS